MGYQGFILKGKVLKIEIEKIINSSIDAELFLYDLIKAHLSEEVKKHVLERINSKIIVNSDHLPEEMDYFMINSACDHPPVIGSENVPDFDPKSDDGGCFKIKRSENNCYNYGNDVVTNTFAQPGEGSGHHWKENTCEDIKTAAISDGLVYMGLDYPTTHPEKGHYLALLIWPNINFHWVRLDSNKLWSHKPGGSPIINHDNGGEEITNPAKQDFSPWSLFCGYFLTIPNKIKIQ